MNKYFITGTALALLALVGCGSSSGVRGEEPTPTTATTQAAGDKGPVCVSAALVDGLHVLRGGGFSLPGGAGVQYAEGETRTATLRGGAHYRTGQRQWTVKPGTRVSVSGHAYTVRQICSYRVVLEPHAAEDKTALAAAPTSMESTGGPADAPLCFTTNHEVLAAAAASFPSGGENLYLLGDGGVKRFPTALSLTVSYLDTHAGTAGIAANCASVQVAAYGRYVSAMRWSSRGCCSVCPHERNKR